MTDIKQATERALEAFWSAVGEAFPEATGGDYEAAADAALVREARAAVREWVDLNVPAHTAHEAKLDKAGRRCGLNADWNAQAWRVAHNLYVLDNERNDGVYSLVWRNLDAEDGGEAIELQDGDADRLIALVDRLRGGYAAVHTRGLAVPTVCGLVHLLNEAPAAFKKQIVRVALSGMGAVHETNVGRVVRL